MSAPKPRLGRKLLVATVGLASVSYVACGSDQTSSSGNLMPPPDTGKVDAPPDDIGSGNLAPPPDSSIDTSVTDTSADATDAKDGD
jgi:hypothetical protein